MKYIMTIDDSSTVRASVEFTLKDIGHKVMHAENGSEALQKIDDIKGAGDDVALCIVDVNMPVMDGITFVKEFRKTDRFTPILMLTTESEESKIKGGKEAGASGWLVKPFQSEQLVGVVEKLIR